jgi:hypothetical protein
LPGLRKQQNNYVKKRKSEEVEVIVALTGQVVLKNPTKPH